MHSKPVRRKSKLLSVVRPTPSKARTSRRPELSGCFLFAHRTSWSCPKGTPSLPNLLTSYLRHSFVPRALCHRRWHSTRATALLQHPSPHSLPLHSWPAPRTACRRARVATPSSARHQPFRACGGSPHREPPVRAVALTPAGKPRWSHDSLNGTARARRSTTPLARSLRVDPSIRAGPTAPPWTRAHTGSGHSHRSTARSASLTPLDALPGDGLAPR